MNNKDKTDELVKCNVCLKEVPAADVNNSETSDYVAHFCGLECYEKWQKKDKKNEDDRE